VKTRAAELLKIKRTTLIEKMKRLGIPLKGSADPGGDATRLAAVGETGGSSGSASHN
jgi:hypothetical protein